MIRKQIDKLLSFFTLTEVQDEYINADAKLDLLWSQLSGDRMCQAVCITAMLRRGADWARANGVEKHLVHDLIDHIMDEKPSCEMPVVEKIWNKLGVRAEAA